MFTAAADTNFYGILFHISHYCDDTTVSLFPFLHHNLHYGVIVFFPSSSVLPLGRHFWYCVIIFVSVTSFLLLHFRHCYIVFVAASSLSLLRHNFCCVIYNTPWPFFVTRSPALGLRHRIRSCVIICVASSYWSLPHYFPFTQLVVTVLPFSSLFHYWVVVFLIVSLLRHARSF